ncbi:MAG TPA: acyltransferase [Balneolaceae bacterium]|nr:acyltransferase [Balneolaceae bacterium]
MKKKTVRTLWVDYLRSALTVLVVAHHSSLAYTTFAHFDKSAYINSTHPVVDASSWIGLDIFENFNDIFFMSLMFLIGGLFLIRSIQKKGSFVFIKDRFFRLFIPFLFLGTLFMLIAYYPSYYIAYHNTNLLPYIKDFFTVEQWPVGPPWFIWVLFLYNLLFALFYALYMKVSNHSAKLISTLARRPFLFFIALSSITWLLYVPMAFHVGAGTWVGFGPFDFQLSRIFLYFGYFSIGIFLGSTDFNNELFSEQSAIVKKWKLWFLLAIAVYALLTIIANPITRMVKQHQISAFAGWISYFTIYAVSCTLSCIAFLTGFRKLIRTPRSWWNSLSDNAYLIYLIHFIFVIWCQFLLLDYNLPAITKFIITLVVALSLSWWTSYSLRKIRIFKRYL